MTNSKITIGGVTRYRSVYGEPTGGSLMPGVTKSQNENLPTAGTLTFTLNQQDGTYRISVNIDGQTASADDVAPSDVIEIINNLAKTAFSQTFQEAKKSYRPNEMKRGVPLRGY